MFIDEFFWPVQPLGISHLQTPDKMLGRGTRPVVNRAATVLRQAANTLMRSCSRACETAISPQLSLATEAVWRLQPG